MCVCVCVCVCVSSGTAGTEALLAAAILEVALDANAANRRENCLVLRQRTLMTGFTF